VKSTKDVTPATDIYSLGVVLWQMVKGYAPYNPSTSGNFDIQSKIVHESLPLTNTIWDSVIQKATDKVEKSRFDCLENFKDQMNNLIIDIPSNNDKKNNNQKVISQPEIVVLEKKIDNENLELLNYIGLVGLVGLALFIIATFLGG
jgi:serine/threonine protein kinase